MLRSEGGRNKTCRIYRTFLQSREDLCSAVKEVETRPLFLSRRTTMGEDLCSAVKEVETEYSTQCDGNKNSEDLCSAVKEVETPIRMRSFCLIIWVRIYAPQ